MYLVISMVQPLYLLLLAEKAQDPVPIIQLFNLYHLCIPCKVLSV